MLGNKFRLLCIMNVLWIVHPICTACKLGVAYSWLCHLCAVPSQILYFGGLGERLNIA